MKCWALVQIMKRTHKKFIEKEKLPFRLLADVEKSVHSKYGTWIEKSMYGRKYMGTARVTYIIDENGIIREVIEKVDTKNHAAQILGDKSSAPEVKATPKKIAAKKAARKVPKENSNQEEEIMLKRAETGAITSTGQNINTFQIHPRLNAIHGISRKQNSYHRPYPDFFGLIEIALDKVFLTNAI